MVSPRHFIGQSKRKGSNGVLTQKKTENHKSIVFKKRKNFSGGSLPISMSALVQTTPDWDILHNVCKYSF